MREELELGFRKVINEITKSDKSAIIMLDGKAGSLKKKMVDKLIDRIEPSRYELNYYDRKKFITKPFWKNGVSKHVISVWDGSYKQESNLSKKQRKEIAFFEQQMERYGFPILAFKFKEGNQNTILEYNDKSKCWIITGNDTDAVFEVLISKLQEELQKVLATKPVEVKVPESIGPKVDLGSVKNDYIYNEKDWKEKQDKLQDEIRKLHEKMIDKGKRLVILFQGIDGAGKSSSIRRMTAKMCPHWYTVYGIKAPTQEELEHHHLWRFITKLPKKGEIVIYDRSWYERLTAERVLKLNNNMWVYGVDEIKEFERELEKNGTHIVKFFYTIDKDTQGQRFKEREQNPLKTWKVSDSDYKTREKWDEYQKVFQEMLASTDFDFSKWHIVNSVNKREARINAMQILVDEMKKALKK